jgi:predicted SprT family Zn-dependent metalloprotease
MVELSRECQWARALALSLMAEHGLSAWLFRFNKNLRRAGVCFYPGRTRPGRIELSVHFVQLNTEADIRDTILHEIAHALTGPHHGHDDLWKATCVRIGARPERCYDSDQIVMPRGKWIGECQGCRKKYFRHRRPRTLVGWHCRGCGKERGPLVWSVSPQS